VIDNSNIAEVVEVLKKAVKLKPYVQRKVGDPFKVLVSTVLSARTKDETTEEASERLFSRVKTVEDLARLSVKEIEKLIYPVGFYRNKARALKKMAEVILKNYGGKVPDSLEELLKLPGVGRKTANLVLILGFDKDAICVDTHVHRIVNRWGYVKTKSPEETEMALREKLPREYWKIINGLLVAFGKTVCKPMAPLCNQCPLAVYCPRIGVKKPVRAK